MLSPSNIVWEAIGKPGTTKPIVTTQGICAVCGIPINGECVLIENAFGDNFTERQYILYSSHVHVCLACIWAMSGRPSKTNSPVRMYSILYREDVNNWNSSELAPNSNGAIKFANKSDLDYFWMTLVKPPCCKWFLSLADSGKIHTLPNTKVNHDNVSWTIRFERQTITSTPKLLGNILFHTMSLYAGKFSVQDIVGMNPHPSVIAKNGVSLWREHIEPLKPFRGSALIDLATFFLRKDKINEQLEQFKQLCNI